MKGIILAGGSGIRLYPVTNANMLLSAKDAVITFDMKRLERVL